ncbi:unnamed protein product [Rhizoctonia solani]|uniref:BTB domain-containing protein n=1 Tax=Rhizoctonia solani TaxID=456999 RepID=A0A8H3BD32_9AGAM|nr:unnamed protein product [Rhizoctonia solani]CAE6454812.1 unnamed protein product [Rhizoctonia solani]
MTKPEWLTLNTTTSYPTHRRELFITMGISISTQLEPFSVTSIEWKKRCFGEEQIVDHPEYYFPDGNIIVVVKDTAFNLYRGILQRHARLFEDRGEDALHLNGPIDAKVFTTLCQFLFPREIGVIPIVRPGDTKTWHPVIRGTIELGMPGVRKHILNKLAEDKTTVEDKAADFLFWIQDDDQDLKKLLFECIRVLAYRRSPLSTEEALGLSGTRVNEVAVARERVRSLFYNPNYWKVRIPNTLCRAAKHHCSDEVFLAMTKQMSISVQSNKSGPQTNLLQIAIDSMCTVCSTRYAESIKQHADLEIRKCLEGTNETEDSNSNSSNKVPLKSWCFES